MFWLNIKRLVKSPVFLVSIIGYFIVLYFLQPIHQATGIEDISNRTLQTQTFSFVFFMMISYEFFYQTKFCKLDEMISVSKMGLLKEKSYGFLLFVGFDLILYMVYLAVSVLGTFNVMGELNISWVWLLVKAFFIYHFLLYLFAILIGMLISFITSRTKAIVALTLVFSLFSRIILPIIMRCVGASEKWTHIFDILGIMNRNYAIFCDLFYNYSIEFVNIQRILFWILFSILGLCILVNRGKKHIITGIVALATCFMFALYVQPAGYRYNGGDWGAYMADQQYYTLLYENNKDGIARSYQKADFKVLKYEGQLSAKRKLDAVIDVIVDENGLEEYHFTLYHGYKILSVSDGDGKSLRFVQDGDHVLVHNNENKNVGKIRFQYTGYSRKYVATSQAVFLGGNFPYLPQPGWNVYMSEPVEVYGDPEISMSWEQEYNLEGLGYKADYDIQFNTDNTVYSNLSEGENSRFTGTSEGATFVASEFIKPAKVRNCMLYYSVLSVPYFEANIEETLKNYENVLDSIPESEEWQEMKIFDLMFFGDGDPVFFFAADHMIADSGKIAECYPYYREYRKTPGYSDMDEANRSKVESVMQEDNGDDRDESCG